MNFSFGGPARVIDGECARIAVEISPHAQPAIPRLGRTEDIRFSPNSRRLAVAGYLKNSCFLFEIAIDRAGARPAVRILDYLELRSDLLAEPHGFDFIGNDTLVIANRTGDVTIFAIPERAGEDRVCHCDPVRVIRRAGFLRRLGSPGSVCVVGATGGRTEILVCNNYKNRITRHVFPHDGRFAWPDDRIVLENALDVPDGIAVSPDRAWVAISNHMTASVLVFDNRSGLRRSAEPAGTLGGVSYPHGLRFSPDGRRLYVADAGAPLVHVYESAGDWSGPGAPVRTVAVLD
ncbi:MAG: hypothetical protein WAU86_22255, partial [Oricola sp.]